MNTALGAFLSFLLLYKYVALFLLIFSSAIILPLPDNSMYSRQVLFASEGYFGFWASLAVSLIADVAGDCVGYFLAKRWGRAALERLHIRVPWYIDRLDAYLRRHPRRSIFFTRFVGLADSVVNVLSPDSPAFRSRRSSCGIRSEISYRCSTFSISATCSVSIGRTCPAY